MYSCKRFLETLLCTGKCAWSSESLCSSRWSHHKTVQTNTVEPFISKQKLQIHFAMWRIRCQSRSIMPISKKHLISRGKLFQRLGAEATKAWSLRVVNILKFKCDSSILSLDRSPYLKCKGLILTSSLI